MIEKYVIIFIIVIALTSKYSYAVLKFAKLATDSNVSSTFKYRPTLLGTGLIALIVAVSVFIIDKVMPNSKEGFHFEVTPHKKRCAHGFHGLPVSFEYTPDADRFECSASTNPETMGWDGLLGNNISYTPPGTYL